MKAMNRRKNFEVMDTDKMHVIQVHRCNNQDEAVDIRKPMDNKQVVDIDYKNLYEIC